jgi:hypothetical protein
MRGDSVVEGVDEVAHRVNRGPLSGLDGLEYVIGQLCRSVDRFG